jgi:hypothetical protein
MNRDSVIAQGTRRSAACGPAVGIVGLALLLQACGGSEDTSPNGTAAVNAIDPCTLVTADEAAQALGAAAQADRPSEANIPPRLATCRYTAPRGAGLAVMTVMVRQGYSDTEARTGFEGAREVFGDAENIDLGDQAFFAAEQLHVLRGTTHLTISGDFSSAVARDLAEGALERL